MGYKKDMSKYENLEGWERCGFGEQLDRWAEKYGERTAVTDSEDEISYMELKQKADCLAAAFLRKGILKGDKVLVQLPNRISFVIVFFALSKIGAVPIMMLPAHREAEDCVPATAPEPSRSVDRISNRGRPFSASIRPQRASSVSDSPRRSARSIDTR